MATFPLLSTGAVTQYPLVIRTGQAAQVLRFLDGSDQRFLTQGRRLRQWQIRLDLLTESELGALELFFAGQLGDYSVFSFPDPASGSDVPNCRFAETGWMSDYKALDVGATSFWVVETNG